MMQVTHCVTISNPVHRPRWNPPLPALLIAWVRLMWRAGLSGAEIAAEAGMSRGAVYNLRLRLDLPPRPKLGLAHAVPGPVTRRTAVVTRAPLPAGSASSWAAISQQAWRAC